MRLVDDWMAILDALPDALAVIAGSKIAAANAAFIRLVEADYARLMNREVLSLVSESEKSRVRRWLADPQARVIFTKFRIGEKEIPIRLQISGVERPQEEVAVLTVQRTDDPCCQLASERKMLSTLMNVVPDTIYFKDREGRFIRINKAQADMLGIANPEDAVGKTDFDFFNSEHAQQAYIDEQVILDTGQPLIGKYERLQRPDGKTVWVTATKVPITDEQGRIVGIVGISRDVTDSVKREEALRENEARYRAVVEAQNDLILRMLPDGTLTFVNNAACRFYGMDRHHLLGERAYEALPSHFPGNFADYVRSFSAQSPEKSSEHWVERWDGQQRWIQWHDCGFFDELGQLQEIQSVGRDLTPQKRAEQALRESQSKIERLHDVAIRLERAHDEQEICRIVVAAAESILNFSACTIDLVDGEVLKVKAASTGLPSGGYRDMSIYEGLAGKTYRTGKSYLLNSRQADPEATPVSSTYQSFISVPVSDLGVFQVISDQQDAFTQKDLELAELLVSHASEALKRIRSEERIRYISFHDALTGLYNRGFFEEEVRRLDTERQFPLSLIVGDINGLKLVNDALGHAAGDQLLRRMAEILHKCCRQEDIIARWGGDEFAILLPRTRAVDAQKLIKRIKQACDVSACEHIPMSIALGYATKTQSSQSISDLIKRAEDQMYRYKLIEGRTVRDLILGSLEQTLLEKSNETKEHAVEMQKMAVRVGEELNLSGTELDKLVLLASLHDIGKIALSEDVLKKKEALTDQEWAEIKKHPEIGYRIALSSPELASIAEGILSHHEWWDGSGYPRGLKREEIPLVARIVSILDAYNVMISGRPYKPAVSPQEAVLELKRCAGTQFDPNLVEVFVRFLQESEVV